MNFEAFIENKLPKHADLKHLNVLFSIKGKNDCFYRKYFSCFFDKGLIFGVLLKIRGKKNEKTSFLEAGSEKIFYNSAKKAGL